MRPTFPIQSTQTLVTNVTREEALKFTIQVLRDVFDFREGSFVSDGKLVVRVRDPFIPGDDNVEFKTLRAVTEEEKQGMYTLNRLRMELAELEQARRASEPAATPL